MAKYSLFTSKEIKPAGWMKKQLLLQANGLAGNLDKVWPDVRDSMWVGGDREGWERVPYWLDGFIPLAYLLEDDDLIARAKRYVNKIVEGQEPDGWICPNGRTPREKYDTWAVLLLSKVLTVYYDCSADERIPEVLLRAMKNFYELLSAGTIKLFNWGKARWYEGFVALNFLRSYYPNEDFIPKLARILKDQGTDYLALTELWKDYTYCWNFETHVVNATEMLKYEALSCELLGEDYTDDAEKLYRALYDYNGTAAGIVTGDELLAGVSPIQGSELCSVVELMYSFEHLYAFTGDKKWADRLETAAFNALPASISDDMWTHQYVQMSNQMQAAPFTGKPPFTTNNDCAHIFGLEPHFGCCTANHGQGWPKLALSSFMRADDGVVSAVAVPAVLSAKYNGTDVKVELATEYPFKNKFTYKVTASADTDMKLYIRIPDFAEDVVYDIGEKAGDMLVISGFKAGENTISVSYKTTPKFKCRPGDMTTVKCGSLVFSVPVKGEWLKHEYTKDGVERKFPYCDYHVVNRSEWRYAYASDKLTLVEGEIGDIPFSSESPAIKVVADTCVIDWEYEPHYNNLPMAYPKSRKAVGEAAPMELYPYGCAKLRMTELPKIK